MADPLDYQPLDVTRQRMTAAEIYSIYVTPWLCGVLLVVALVPSMAWGIPFMRSMNFPVACDLIGLMIATCGFIILAMKVAKGARKYIWNCVLAAVFIGIFLYPWVMVAVSRLR
jgi:hypothetical protein